VGVTDDESKELLVIDWRAPVASLFYTFSGGEEEVFYESPEGIIECQIHLKRNIVIRNQVLQRVVDTYIRGESKDVSGVDEFLLYRLGENKDHRLRDIVSTIQTEQNEIIRCPKNRPVIIQGVAGSGKTTVALHRLAYLLYEYREHISAQKMIIFAPNRMFLEYISNVLPELGVGNIQQTTFTDWALELLDEEISLVDPSLRLIQWFEENQRDITSHFKGSIEFKQIIGDCLQHYEKTSIPNKDFEAWEGFTIDKETIATWFLEELQAFPMMKRKEKIIARIKRSIEIECKSILEKVQAKELRKKANQRLRSYVKSWLSYSPIDLYKSIFGLAKRKEMVPGNLYAQIPKQVRERTQITLKQNRIEVDDLAPLIYIHHRYYGIEKQQHFHHVVIDEAQDFSAFQVDILRQYTPSQSFTILGDLSQGIHSYQGITDWGAFKQLFKEQECKYYELEKSYRSTTEIINVANYVITQVGEPVTLAKPIFRSGEKVKKIKGEDSKKISTMVTCIQDLQNKNANTIAIMGRHEKECERVYRNLKREGIELSYIDSKQREYSGGISVLPVYLSKGLEFDAVLLIDVDEENYQKNIEDAKLLYVGCTRALHHLYLLSNEYPSPLIKEMNVDEMS
jgi:DNA helicase-2/ATP-dependent DNA helicase PcrA